MNINHMAAAASEIIWKGLRLSLGGFFSNFEPLHCCRQVRKWRTVGHGGTGVTCALKQ